MLPPALVMDPILVHTIWQRAERGHGGQSYPDGSQLAVHVLRPAQQGCTHPQGPSACCIVRLPRCLKPMRAPGAGIKMNPVTSSLCQKLPTGQASLSGEGCVELGSRKAVQTALILSTECGSSWPPARLRGLAVWAHVHEGAGLQGRSHAGLPISCAAGEVLWGKP